MADPFYAECPECRAQLIINDPAALGRRVRCPNCETVFTADQPLGFVPPPPPSGDFGYEEDPDEEYDKYEPSGHRPKKQCHVNAWGTMLAVGIGIVVVGMIATVLLLPMRGHPLEATHRRQDKNNLKQVGLAMHNYHDVYGAFPVLHEEDKHEKRRPFLPPVPPPHKADQRNPQLSWRVYILPFIEQQALYEKFHLDEPWYSRHNRKLIKHMPEVYKRPGSDLPIGKTVYLGVAGPGAVMEDGGGTPFREITDGASNTLLVVEVEDEHAVTWTKPEDYEYDPRTPKRHLGGWDGGFHALLCDGAVRFLSHEIPPHLLVHLFQKDDGHDVQHFQHF